MNCYVLDIKSLSNGHVWGHELKTLLSVLYRTNTASLAQSNGYLHSSLMIHIRSSAPNRPCFLIFDSAIPPIDSIICIVEPFHFPDKKLNFRPVGTAGYPNKTNNHPIVYSKKRMLGVDFEMKALVSCRLGTVGAFLCNSTITDSEGRRAVLGVVHCFC